MPYLALLAVSACADARPTEGAGRSEDSSSVADASGPMTSADASPVTPNVDAGAPVQGGDAARDASAREACSPLESVPRDPGKRGPWEVSARTVKAANLTLELWYPAEPTSTGSKVKARYDLREHLQPNEAAKVKEEDNPFQPCDCVRDLPMDASAGPYPVIVFVHGTAGVRTQNLSQMTHWASRGFVVVAADHPYLTLKDISGLLGPANLVLADPAADLGRLLAALDAPSGELAFLKGQLDMTRLGFSGQSRGGSEFQRYADRAKVFVPLTSALAKSPQGKTLESTLMMAAQDDTIASYADQKRNYEGSPARKRFVGVKNAGHVSFTDMCALGRERGGLLAIAKANGVSLGGFVESLATDGCAQGQIEPARIRAIIDYATTAAFEESLRCDRSMGVRLSQIQAVFPEIGEYLESL